MTTRPKKSARENPEWVRLDDELGWDDVGGRLLANIAKGMYNPQGVLREYVQNAVDAYKDLDLPSDEHKIYITPTQDGLSIQDFGVGMDGTGIREAKKIAVSTKSEHDDRVGFRGIGIWAGLPACKRLVVDSTKAGHSFRYRLVFDFEGIMLHLDDNINIKTLIDPRYKIEQHAANKDDHFTRVTLEGITEGYKKLLDLGELKRIASQLLPTSVDPSFQHHASLTRMLETWPGYCQCHISIQTDAGLEEAFRKFPEDDIEPPVQEVLLSEQGVELARAWFCRTKKTSLRYVTPPAVRGFQLRVKNFAVGEVNMFSAEQGYRYNIHEHQELKTASRLAWYCGEIHITNNDIKPNTPRDDLELEKAARLFIEKLRGFYKDRIIEAGAYSEFNPFRSALEEAEELVAKAANQDIGKPPLNIDAVLGLIARLSEVQHKAKGASDEQDKKLFKQLLRQQWFKDRVTKVLPQLRKLAPSPTPPTAAPAKPNGPSLPAPPSPAPSPGPRAIPEPVKPTGKYAVPPQSPAPNTPPKPLKSGGAANAEELISEIFGVLERYLGIDYEDLPQIQEQIQQIVDSWTASDA